MDSALNRLHEVSVPIVHEPVHKVIVPDPDVHIFGISHPNHVDLIQSPLSEGDDAQHDQHAHPVEQRHGPQDSHQPSFSSQYTMKEPDPEEPVLKKAHEAPTIQLFFDLYFVANLTTFSAQHDIHSADGKAEIKPRKCRLMLTNVYRIKIILGLLYDDLVHLVSEHHV